jgi:hypothetical protein
VQNERENELNISDYHQKNEMETSGKRQKKKVNGLQWTRNESKVMGKRVQGIGTREFAQQTEIFQS